MIDVLFDEAITKVENYKERRQKPKNLRDASYSEWALDEILNRLCEEVANDPKLLYFENALYTPKDVVDIFYLEMEYMEDRAATPRQKLIFGIAKDEAGNVIDIL